MPTGTSSTATSAARARRLVGRAPARELVPPTPGLSARWHVHDYPGPYCRWHHHPEHEIHLIQHGTGVAIVGDHIGRFGPGHLVLVGSNLPHHWISDVADGERVPERDVVLQLHPDWFDACTRLLPELGDVRQVLDRAARGIEFSGAAAEVAAAELLALGHSTGTRRLQHLLTLLTVLDEAPATEARLLASPWTPPLDQSGASDVVDRTLAYVFAHVDSHVSVAEAAGLAGMSESGFSRFFRRASGQSFTDTVRKLRLTHACHLLEHTDLPVATVATRIGYRNLSNFNRQFRAAQQATPRAYRRSHQATSPSPDPGAGRRP